MSATLMLIGIAFLGAIASVGAQVRVDLAVPRTLFIRYEPLLAQVTITNQSGQELEFADEGNYKWFSFKIQTTSGRLVPPYNPDYQLSPIQIGPGQSAKRLVNLTPLYPMTEYGVYRLTATIYSRQLQQFFSSEPALNVEITEGREIWQEDVGGPNGAGVRTISLLSHRLPEYTQLYIRIMDENGNVFCNHQLGRLVLTYGIPDIELDADNNTHILQNVAPKRFLYSVIGSSGEVRRRDFYESVKTKPQLRRVGRGGVEVVGGIYVDPNREAVEGEAPVKAPSVSDRPVPIPGAAE
ncbi:MAG: hypothetical protein WA771_07160 [Chthoniobacterales bacterium]